MTNNGTASQIRKKEDACGMIVDFLVKHKNAPGQKFNCIMHLQPTTCLPPHGYQGKRSITQGIPSWDHPCAVKTLGCTGTAPD
jgi:hypothetical protein